jgi:hypothetical protein
MGLHYNVRDLADPSPSGFQLVFLSFAYAALHTRELVYFCYSGYVCMSTYKGSSWPCVGSIIDATKVFYQGIAGVALFRKAPEKSYPETIMGLWPDLSLQIRGSRTAITVSGNSVPFTSMK